MSVLGLADQYSLGCVLYECLTGRVPFEKDLDAAIIFAHAEERPTMPTVLRPDLPPAVDEVFSRVLAKQPGDRYGSCREFIEAARVALGSLAAEPALTPPPGPAKGPAAGPQAGQARHGDTIVSHRRAAGEPPPPGPQGPPGPPGAPGAPDGRRPAAPRRWFARPRWIAALTALVLIAAGAGTWALVGRGPGTQARNVAMSSMSATRSRSRPAR